VVVGGPGGAGWLDALVVVPHAAASGAITTAALIPAATDHRRTARRLVDRFSILMMATSTSSVGIR
jgi:hypothetical protein